MYHKGQVTCCILVALVIAIDIGSGQTSSGECKCVAFDNAEGLGEPIITVPLPRSMIRVPCNDDGVRNCKHKCHDLVKKVPVHLASNYLCQRLNKNINIPQIHQFASVCDTAEWIPTGFKILKGICCEAVKSVPCNFE